MQTTTATLTIRADLDRYDVAVDQADPLRALNMAQVIQDEAAQLLRDTVAEAKAGGATWDQIGNVLAISRQAAQQRFS